MSTRRTAGSNTRKDRIWTKTKGHCHLCGECLSYEEPWAIDHLVPRASGGPDDEWNLLPACHFCNRMKKAAITYKMRRVLMYGRYCLDKATEREISGDGALIYEIVGRRVQNASRRAKIKPPHVQLWKQTPKK